MLMMLNAEEIVFKGIVQPVSIQGQRTTTYDATVGEIICAGKKEKNPSFILKSRGVVWVVSSETFKIPEDVTGVATLRTTWAHKGIFALNVGVIDPGWNGPLATAIVNFGQHDFVVEKGEPFFRILFLKHNPSELITYTPNIKDRSDYINEITLRSHSFSETFLNMTTLVKEVADKVLGLPNWLLLFTKVALGISFFALLIPIVFSFWNNGRETQVKLGILEKRIAAMEEEKKKSEAYGSQFEIHVNIDNLEKAKHK
jgi:deoxycytidine triphosphate deaminase